MKKNILLLAVVLFFLASQSFSQDSISPLGKTYRIALFAPMYLDSVFTNNELISSNSIPKFIIPAIEFTQGARIALDTVSLNGKHAEAYIYDSKPYTQTI